jgi:hypothetical protein
LDWTRSLRLLAILAGTGAAVAGMGWNVLPATGYQPLLVATGSLCCGTAGFMLWLRALGMRTTMTSVPTARLASAPQGYVELNGRARRLSAEFSALRPHWLWQRITRSRGTPALEVTEAPFCFSDGAATAVILPEGADVICKNRYAERNGNARTVTESIHSGETLYVLGYLSSVDDVSDLAAEAERMASDIRLDPAARRRFDADGDGRLDIRESLKLHASAYKMAQERATGQQTHVISRPPDGRPYIISTVPIPLMSARFLAYSWLGLALGLAGVVSATAWAATWLVAF